jgi:hypothetical protein
VGTPPLVVPLVPLAPPLVVQLVPLVAPLVALVPPLVPPLDPEPGGGTQRHPREADGARMPGPAPSVDTLSNPTLDVQTDAIILREGAGAVASTYLRGTSSCPPPSVPDATPGATTEPNPTATPTPTPTPTPTSSSGAATPTTATEPPPFGVRKQAFRAAPIVVGVGPATERARLRALAAAAPPRPRAPMVRAHRAGRAHSPSWTVLAAFALGTATVAVASLFADHGLEIAACTSTLAGMMTLAVALSRIRAQNGAGRRPTSR